MVIYEIINTVNNKRYIGKDKHNNPNYFGSGRLINKAIKKYGKDKFIKIILEYCDSEEHMCEQERYWIRIADAQHSDLYLSDAFVIVCFLISIPVYCSHLNLFL
jgi:hypothetical protein